MPKRRRSNSNVDQSGTTIGNGTPEVEESVEPLPGRLAGNKRSTACTECRKHKMKCVMTNERAACIRCTRRNIACEVAPGPHMLSKHYSHLQSDVRNMHETLRTLCRQLGMEEPLHLASVGISELPAHGTNGQTDEEEQSETEDAPLITTPSIIQAPMDTFLDNSKARPTPSAHQSQQSRRSANLDLVAQNLITLKTAENLVDRYFSRLDQSLYGIASRYSDIAKLREASSILFAAVCTVSAMHDPSDQQTYEICNREFQRLISNSLFDKSGVEHLRALCVGSFWLVDSARVLISEGIRRATDNRLHRHFYALVKIRGYEAIFENPMIQRAESRDKIRLWFILFICDQHLSILYNRPGLLQHDTYMLSKWLEYLSSDGADHQDTRIMSQVSLLIIMHRIRDTCEEEQMSMSIVSNLASLSRDIENWRKRILELYTPDPNIGDFPRAGIQMHYQFAKFYLYHHVYRGLKSDHIPEYFLPAAEEAHLAAISLFELLQKDASLLASMGGRPHYVFIMFAFAGHFLLEVCSKYSQHKMVVAEDVAILEGALSALNKVQMVPQHPINRLKRGLKQKLDACCSELGKDQGVGAEQGQHVSGQNFFYDTVSATESAVFGDTQASMNDPFYSDSGQFQSILDDFANSDFGNFDFPDMNLNF